MKRRQFLGSAATTILGACVLPHATAQTAVKDGPRYRLALGQWSFHRAFRGEAGVARRDPLEFPTIAGELGFSGVDYSGHLLAEHHTSPIHLAELNRRASNAGVSNVVILVDLSDPLGAADTAARKANVEKYRPWLAAAATLGCTGIRVNPIAEGNRPAGEQARLLADGLARLVEFSAPLNLDVMIENHGEGLRTDGAWLASVAKRVAHPRCGTLPDFGNFQKNRTTGEFHDRYTGVAAMLPLAKAVCAKSHDFDANGNECYSDYGRLLNLVADSGFRGWIEVEYEGPGGSPRTLSATRSPEQPLGEREGTLATKRLLEKLLGADLSRKG